MLKEEKYPETIRQKGHYTSNCSYLSLIFAIFQKLYETIDIQLQWSIFNQRVPVKDQLCLGSNLSNEVSLGEKRFKHRMEVKFDIKKGNYDCA